VSESQPLAENEFVLMREIARSPTVTQRDLSQSTGLSLGMTNLLIKRLARKGYIKVAQLDWKRAQYVLTPKGAMEKAVKSYRYGLYTIRIFRQIRENILVALRREYDSGRRSFAVVAQDELLDLVREAAETFGPADARFTYCSRFSELSAPDAVVLTATLEPAPEPRPGRRLIRLVDFDDIDFRIQ
jgi:DNA-binding MarR family transcriptional regulator